MTDHDPRHWLKRFPLPQPAPDLNEENRVRARIRALHRSRDFFRKWLYATIIATQRGMPFECGNPACRRKRQCTGQMRPVIYSDAELSCTPPCLSVFRNRQYRAALGQAVRDIEFLVHQHGFAAGVKQARRMAWL